MEKTIKRLVSHLVVKIRKWLGDLTYEDYYYRGLLGEEERERFERWEAIRNKYRYENGNK